MGRLGQRYEPAERRPLAQRLTTRTTAEGLDYGLGIIDFGNGWIGHSGQLIGCESLVLYDTGDVAIAVTIVNETASLIPAEFTLATIFPDYGETLGFRGKCGRVGRPVGLAPATELPRSVRSSRARRDR